jgi:hypothetical protein
MRGSGGDPRGATAHLRQVQGDTLVGGTNADAQEDAACNEHAQVLSGGVEDGADEEGNAGAQHGQLAAVLAGDNGGHGGGEQASQEQAAREQGQGLAVKHLQGLCGVVGGWWEAAG